MPASASQDTPATSATSVPPVTGSFPIACRVLAIPAGFYRRTIARGIACARET